MVNDVQVIASVLGRGGSTYRVLDRCRLGTKNSSSRA